MIRLGDHLRIASPSGGSALQLVPSLEEVTQPDKEPAMKIADTLSGRSSHNDGRLGHGAGYWLLERLRARGTLQVCVTSPEEQ